MKKFFGSLFVKMLAFVLVCMLCPVLLGCGYFAAYAFEEGFYYGEKAEFESSAQAKRFVSAKLANVCETIYWNDIYGLLASEYYFDQPNFAYTVFDSEGNEVVSTVKEGTTKKYTIHKPEEKGSSGYIEVVTGYPAKEVDSEGNVIAEYEIDGYIFMPMTPDYSGYSEYAEYCFIYDCMYIFLYVGAACFAVCAILFLYIMSKSGIDEKGEFALRGTNAVDIDILAAIYCFGVVFLADVFYEITGNFEGILLWILLYLVLAAATAVTLIMGMSVSAHLRMKQGWKHSCIFQLSSLAVRFIRWFLRNIGICWKLGLAVFGYSLVIFVLGIMTDYYSLGPAALLVAIFIVTAGICLAIWFGIQLLKIRKGGEAIAEGDFEYRINTRELWPMLRRHAWNLNSAAVGMSKAVDDRLKSEHFRTELITNVSHDLKTPLTSIVSYVDLLKKENIESEAALGYIEVIDRQSRKLRKLTEDLLEASKATSGAISVNPETVNVGELINQSVGEFSEKFEKAEIIPVVTIPEKEVLCHTDGRLLWRVFDNLIQNIIKYAQPGTRAYFDLSSAGGNAILTMRNISREPLNLSAEELMERFVRGDSSRNSEGNGLGLSIASSLTELCGGKFELTLDGDLYKVTIVFPILETE